MPFGYKGIVSVVALALSGGGFRNTLFHTGTRLRLNELGYSRLMGDDEVATVSAQKSFRELISEKVQAFNG